MTRFPPDVESMNTKAVFEKYSHLDELLSDRSWLPGGLVGKILLDCWQVIKEEREMNIVKVIIRIEEDQKPIHQVAVEIRGQEQINVESCIEELRALAFKWALTWLKYPDVEVAISNYQV